MILLITITNYTNLSIAMNAGRGREIGMRKVFGAGNRHIVRQFLLEACLLALLAVPVSISLLTLIVPQFNQFMGTDIEKGLVESPPFLLLLPVAALLIGLLSGAYPAFYLARQQQTSLLFQGNTLQQRQKGFTARKGLIVFQFSLLIGLCSLTLFVNQQLSFIQEKDLGYKREGILYVEIADMDNYRAFRQELLQMPEITGVGAGSPLGRTPYNQLTYKLDQTEEVYDDAHIFELDYHAIELLEIETSQPQYFEPRAERPSTLFLVNETAVEKLCNNHDLSRAELMDRAIITEPKYKRDNGEMGFQKPIGGVFNDINMFSLRKKINPYILEVHEELSYMRKAIIGFKASPENYGFLDKIRQAHAQLGEDDPFRYNFLSENLAKLYDREQKIGKLTIYLSITAFFLAVIGLIALTAFLTTLKQREIGIRKILGASVWEILKLFNKEYLALVAIAVCIATPLTYYGVSQWLSNFAYRIDINPLVFLLSAGITLVIALLAVSSITYRVAISDPARAVQENQ